jgi:hypothetical protein
MLTVTAALHDALLCYFFNAHCSLINFVPFSGESLQRVFGTVMDWFLQVCSTNVSSVTCQNSAAPPVTRHTVLLDVACTLLL